MDKHVSPYAHDAEIALRDLNAEMASFRGFPLAISATNIVFGGGPVPCKLMLLGEQPGEQEDLAGQAFVGPAGKLLDKALAEAGTERDRVYVTNTLKHYKFQMEKGRRHHLVPTMGDIKTYLPWLEREIAIVQPVVIVALGTIAGRAARGKSISLEEERGKLFSRNDGIQVILTYHPAFILRTPGRETKEIRYQRLVSDLRLAVKSAKAMD